MEAQSSVSLGPVIPFNNQDAFYPIHASLKGVFYSWDECKYWGLSCKDIELFISFEDLEAMKWFYQQDFGFKRRERP